MIADGTLIGTFTPGQDFLIKCRAAHPDLGLGKLNRRTGKREQAREHLTTATTMYGEIGMPFWLEQADAEMQELY